MDVAVHNYKHISVRRDIESKNLGYSINILICGEQILLMSFWSKLTQNKAITAIVAVASIALGGLYVAYRQSQSQEEESNQPAAKPQPKKEPQFDIQAEIAKLKQQIDINNINIEDVKKIFTLLTQYIKTKTVAMSNKYKDERRKRFPKELRYQRMPEYMRLAISNLTELQQTVMQLQNEQNNLMAAFGLTQQKLMQFGPQLGPFMQQLIFDNDISLDDTKIHLALKTEYLQVHGERLIDALVELSTSLSLEEKQFIPLFLNTVISDEVFEHEPALDREEFDLALEKYKAQLSSELIHLEKILMPLMGKLQSCIAGDEMGGMGGYGGGYGGYPNEYDPNEMGGMGGMGGFSQQAMHQQLEALRQQDPQAYEQLMAMMQAQMGR